MVTKNRRYSITAVRAMIDELQEWLDSSQETLDNAESADYPNDEFIWLEPPSDALCIDKLQMRCDSLQEAIDALENIE